MRRRSLPLVLVVVALLVGGLAWWSRSSTREASVVGAESSTNEDEGRGGPLLGIPTPSAPTEGPERVDPADDATLDGVETTETRELASAGPIVRGRVVIPPGTPSDETLTVFVRTGGARARDKGKKREEFEVDVATDGTFEFPYRGQATRVYLYLHGRYLALRSQKTVWRRDAIDDVVLEPVLGARLRLRLVFENEPVVPIEQIGEIEVRCRRAGKRAGAKKESTVVVEGGVVDVSAVETGRQITIGMNGERFLHVTGTVDPLVPGEAREVEVVVPGGVRVRGAVTDESGRPLPHASVSFIDVTIPGGDALDSNTSDWNWSFNSLRVSANADGEFDAAPLGPGKLRVDYSHDLSPWEGERVLELADAETLDGLHLTLRRGNGLDVEASWPDGSPVSRGYVNVESDAPSGAESERRRRIRWIHTDDSGRCSFTGLPDEPHSVEVRATRGKLLATQFGRKIVTGLRPTSGSISVTVELLPSFVCHVSREDGEPLSSATIDLTEPGSPGRLVTRPIDCGGATYLVGDVVRGEYDVRARSGRVGASSWRRIQVPVDPDAKPIELIIRPWAEITGVVRNATGVPVEDAAVFLSQGGSSDSTDSEGRFRIRRVAAGTHEVKASAEREGVGPARQVTVAPGETADLELTLTPFATIRGAVRGGADGLDQHLYIRLIAEPEEGELFPDVTGFSFPVDGEFSFENVPPGLYSVVAFRAEPEASGGFLSHHARTSVRAVLGQDEYVTLTLEPFEPTRLTGHVTAFGEPVRGSIWAPANIGRSALSVDDDGAFALDVTVPGRVLLFVKRENEEDRLIFVEMNEGEDREIQLEWTELGTTPDDVPVL